MAPQKIQFVPEAPTWNNKRTKATHNTDDGKMDNCTFGQSNATSTDLTGGSPIDQTIPLLKDREKSAFVVAPESSSMREVAAAIQWKNAPRCYLEECVFVTTR